MTSAAGNLDVTRDTELLCWLDGLADSISGYLGELSQPQIPGEYRPCVSGVTQLGTQLRLGYSCFALRTTYAIGRWDSLPEPVRSAWVEYIRAFQLPKASRRIGAAPGAFVDPSFTSYLWKNEPVTAKWRLILRDEAKKQGIHLSQVVVAETKQAIATLMQIGVRPLRPYCGFMQTASDTRRYLESLDWERPWAAGGQSAAYAMFAVTEGRELLSLSAQEELVDIFRTFFDELADSQSGGYFRGTMPAHGEFVNGAMKVLTSLDWLGVPIRYPKQLIDACLRYPSLPEGCHILDALYVLHRCSFETQYRRSDIEQYCWQAVRSIAKHYHPSGGFSYFVGRAQMSYYGAPISHGENEADLHGTYLLSMTLAIIGNIIGVLPNWRIVKP